MRLGLKGLTPLQRFLEINGSRPVPMPEIAGTYSGTLIVCGDGACIWSDLELLGCRSDQGRGGIESSAHFMAVNKIGEVFPGPLEHWYSNDAGLLPKFVAARRQEYGPCGAKLHSCNQPVQHRWPWKGHGTSGLGAILTGLALGYDKIEVAGMPLDNSPHNGEPPWRRGNFTREVADQVNGKPDASWLQAIRYAFDGRVSFASGRAKEWIAACG